MKNADKSIYPLTVSGTVSINENDELNMGLTKREHFAGLAMQGMLENSSLTKSFIAKMAVKMADELLTALEKQTENGSV